MGKEAGRPLGRVYRQRTPEEKEELIWEYYESASGYRVFAESHGIAHSLFYTWLTKYKKEGIAGLYGKRKSDDSDNRERCLYGHERPKSQEEKDLELKTLKKIMQMQQEQIEKLREDSGVSEELHKLRTVLKERSLHTLLLASIEKKSPDIEISEQGFERQYKGQVEERMTDTFNQAEIGKRIKDIRCRKNLKQHELAQLLGVSSNYLSMLERGRKSASLTLIRKIAMVSGMSIDELVYGSDKETSEKKDAE